MLMVLTLFKLNAHWFSYTIKLSKPSESLKTLLSTVIVLIIQQTLAPHAITKLEERNARASCVCQITAVNYN